MARRIRAGESKESHHSTWSIGSQLLLSVNGILILVAIMFLTYDYQRGVMSRVADKRIALDEEAKTLTPAISLMQPHGRESIQQYVDAVCGRMRDSQSPGHHIVVECGADVIQSSAHHRASPEMLQAVRRAAAQRNAGAADGREELIVGIYSQGDTTVYVSETRENIRRAVVGDVILRLVGLILLAGVATAVVDYMLWRVVWRPIKRLVATMQEIGRGNLGVQVEEFRSRELHYLAGEINAMSASLAIADREHQRQMAKASEIQQSLLPKDVEIKGLRLFSLFLPAEDVAGDYYDVIALPDGTHIVCIADVTGHGVPAALNAMMLKVLLVEACERHSDPANILAFINRRLTGVCRTDNFVTMFLVRFNSQQMIMQYANAGHETGLLLPREGNVMELTATGMVLGIMVDQSWGTRTITIRPGDRLLLATDGVTEAMDSRGQLFGRKRLLEDFESSRDLKTNEAIQAIGNAVAEHCKQSTFSDDITLLIFELSADCAI